MENHTPLTIVGITETTIVNKDGAIVYDAADYDVLDFNDAQSICKEIVKAVNNHEQLVKTLQEAKIQIEEYQEMTYTVNKPFKGLLASINVSLSQLESK